MNLRGENVTKSTWEHNRIGYMCIPIQFIREINVAMALNACVCLMVYVYTMHVHTNKLTKVSIVTRLGTQAGRHEAVDLLSYAQQVGFNRNHKPLNQCALIDLCH